MENLSADYFKWFIATDYCHITPELPGCYAIYKLNISTKKMKLFYIGTAKNLYKRLIKHQIKGMLNELVEYPEVTMVKCKLMLDKNKRLYTEKRLIAKLKPPLNKIYK